MKSKCDFVSIQLLLLSLFFSQKGEAQKTLTIMPHYGIQIPICYNVPKYTKSSLFKPNIFDITADIGLSLGLKLNQNWIIDAGVSLGNFGWSYSLNQNQRSSTIGIFRFPVIFNYRLKDFAFLKYNSLLDRYYLAGEIRSIFGFSYDRIQNRSDPKSFVYGDSLEFNTIVRSFNLSLNAGFALQFYHKKKELLLLKFYVSQGILKLTDSEIRYKIYSNSYSNRLISRGTVLGVFATIPITIARFKKRI